MSGDHSSICDEITMMTLTEYRMFRNYVVGEGLHYSTASSTYIGSFRSGHVLGYFVGDKIKFLVASPPVRWSSEYRRWYA